MRLTPLQSRLAASVLASCLIVFLYLVLFSPHFALALDLEVTLPVPVGDLDLPLRLDDRGLLDPTYQPDFTPFSGSLVGRAPPGVIPLENNAPEPREMEEGVTQVFAFEADSIFGRSTSGADSLDLRDEHHIPNLGPSEDLSDGQPGRRDTPPLPARGPEKRQGTKTVYISANTCQQPQRVNASATTANPPQLTMFVSTSPENKAPGPMADASAQKVVEFAEGALMHQVNSSGDDVFFAIHAPNVSDAFTGGYSLQVAVSVDGWFHRYNSDVDADVIWVDSDSQGALLMTHNLTEVSDPAANAALMASQPYVMFAHNKDDPTISGLMYSFCGLQNFAQMATTKSEGLASTVITGMTTRGPGGLPKQQFFFGGLNASSNYQGVLAQAGVDSNKRQTAGNVGGGGVVFRATNFTTKSDHGNCQIILNLPFCDQVAYSVPSNPSKFPNASSLATFYDDYASSMYDNFKKVLQQIPCEAPMDQRYSLARNCSDCEAAYKSWLCSVTIPRCEDFSTEGKFLQPRNVKQPFPDGTSLDAATIASFPDLDPYTASRNPRIDEMVQPGPYKEVLPCDDLCFDLVQSCHPKMEFSCPRAGMPGFNTSYGRRGQLDRNGEVTCNYPGSAHIFSASARTTADLGKALVSSIIGALVVTMI